MTLTNRLSAGLRAAMLAAIVAGLGACASGVKKAELESSSPEDEVQKLDADLSRGLAEHYDILANNDFSRAQRHLDKAEKEMQKGAKSEDVMDNVAYGRAYFNRARGQAETLHERMKGILEARAAALGAGVRKIPRLDTQFGKVDDDVRAEIPTMEKGRTTPERWSKLQRDYLNLELWTIQDTKLANAQAKIDDSVRHGARKNTPNLLSQAERDLQNARNVIASNRHNESSIAPAVQTADETAQLLVETLAATKRPEGVINEDAALAMVRQGRKIQSLGQQAAASAGALGLDRALKDAQTKFTTDEAEVYRQGDKLLIRLKAMEFPTGRAELPEKSLGLLAKVKTIADELNPVHIALEGHTDSTGTPKINEQLSLKRAEAVATYLETNGFESDKIEATGHGSKRPIVTNKTKEGRAQNRRVDVVITPGSSASM